MDHLLGSLYLTLTSPITVWLPWFKLYSQQHLCPCTEHNYVEIMHRSIRFRDYTPINEIAENTGTMF